ncbi:MAG: Hsp20/alpha crystallin family protein [Nitrososphaera sp.]|jgi:HSP20 family protein
MASRKNRITVHKGTHKSAKRLDDVFEDFRQEIERMVSGSLPALAFPAPGFAGSALIERDLPRLPLCDMVDRGSKYELYVEVPGIDREKIKVHGTRGGVEISGEQSEASSEKARNYVYNERSFKSFYRNIATPEEIIPSKIAARMANGILTVEMPKSPSAAVKERGVRVEIK